MPEDHDGHDPHHGGARLGDPTLLADIQERSVRAATELVDRVVAGVAGARPAAGAEDGRSSQPVGGTGGTGGVGDLAGAWAELWRQSVAGLAGLLTGGETAGGPRLDVDRPGPGVAVRITLAPGEHSGTTELWLHNESSTDIDGIEVHVSGLRTHDRYEIGDERISFEPVTFTLPGRSSRGVAVTVDALDCAPGEYRGLVQARGLPGSWVPLEVVVTDGP